MSFRWCEPFLLIASFFVAYVTSFCVVAFVSFPINKGSSLDIAQHEFLRYQWLAEIDTGS